MPPPRPPRRPSPALEQRQPARPASPRPAPPARTTGRDPRSEREEPARPPVGLWIGLAVAVLLVGVVLWSLMRTPRRPPAPDLATVPEPAAEAPAAPATAPASASAPAAKPSAASAPVAASAPAAPVAAVAPPPAPRPKPVETAPDGPEPPESNRYAKYMHRAARGPHAVVVAATPFGTAGHEEFVDAGALADGSIVAFGNAWGPQFPSSPTPTVLGSGRHLGLPPTVTVKDKKGDRQVLSSDDPDMAGMLVFYDASLSAVRRVVRFDWGVASISAGLVTRDGTDLVIAGRATAAFRAVHAKAPVRDVQPPPAKSGAYDYQGTACTGDVYVMRIRPDGTPVWAWILEAVGRPPEQFWLDRQGAVYFDSAGLKRIAGDGRALTLISDRAAGRTAKWLAIDPADGNGFYGGDRNTKTNREPYRQPYLYKIDGTGAKLATLWEPDPKQLGSDTPIHLESDSSPRAMDFAADGDLLVGGWSDGGNSVFPRQALDMTRPASGAGFGMSPWGMKGANSLTHLMRIDPRTFETKAHTWWACYLPASNAPNHASIRSLRVAPVGVVAITGKAATGLIQTPNAFVPRFDDVFTGYGGEFVTVFNEDFTRLRFSSYLPGCENATIGTTADGVLVVSRATATDNRQPPSTFPAPGVKPLQAHGGAHDAHIVLLRAP